MLMSINNANCKLRYYCFNAIDDVDDDDDDDDDYNNKDEQF